MLFFRLKNNAILKVYAKNDKIEPNMKDYVNKLSAGILNLDLDDVKIVFDFEDNWDLRIFDHPTGRIPMVIMKINIDNPSEPVEFLKKYDSCNSVLGDLHVDDMKDFYYYLDMKLKSRGIEV